MPRRLSRAVLVTSAVVLAVTACTETRTTMDPGRVRPTLDLSTEGAQLFVASVDTVPTDTVTAPVPAPTQLLACPTTDQASSRAVIGPDGGSVGARGSVLTLPAGAVAEPTEFEVIVPASQYVEVHVHAVGRESFQFQKPAYISINFARCTSLPTEKLQAVYVDGSGTIAEVMGVGADRVNKKLVFTTPHLSGYAIAWAVDTTATTTTPPAGTQ